MKAKRVVVIHLPCARLPPGCVVRRLRAIGGRLRSGLHWDGPVAASRRQSLKDGRLRWGAVGMNLSRYAIEVVDVASGRVVAGIGYDRGRHHELISFGTWVHPQHRRHGLGLLLWELAVNYEGAREVRMTLVSDRGRTLVHRLERALPRVFWNWHQSSNRPLRVLKTKKEKRDAAYA